MTLRRYKRSPVARWTWLIGADVDTGDEIKDESLGAFLRRKGLVVCTVSSPATGLGGCEPAHSRPQGRGLLHVPLSEHPMDETSGGGPGNPDQVQRERGPEGEGARGSRAVDARG